ncbi:MAG: C39 family peptidase [Candidatus Acidiferrales bacterium]|jgi:ABC-type bacteriocin/lantibiotic exporter with double-glycine peptidase domain
MRSPLVSVLMVCLSAPAIAAADNGAAGVWLDVPFVKQPENGCGAASIAMVLRYWSAHDVQVPPDKSEPPAIQRALYSAKAKGIFASAMARYLDNAGMQAYAFRGEWADLRHHLSLGRPLIAALKPRSGGAPLHYVVIVGLDWDRDAVFVNDPARGKLLRVERPEFEKQWRAAGNWTLLAVPRQNK